jgi:hypothetical protein
MDLAAAFLLSLLGGYCFAYVWRVTAFTTKRIEGHHLYFQAALWGTMFFSIALALRLALIRNFPPYQDFELTLVDYLRPALRVEALDPIREPVAVTLLPIFSGNRDAEGRLNLTTDYEALYSTLSRGRAAQLGLPSDWSSQFELTIRADQIVTAALFSAPIYAEFNPGWKQHSLQ